MKISNQFLLRIKGFNAPKFNDWKSLSFVLLLFCLGSFQSQNKIYWDQNRPLNFSDFKGSPQYKSAAAMSYCGIKFNSCNQRGQTTYEVSAYFEPHNSWVWQNYKYPYVIKHEQLHFDIAEIYARKMRKYFAENYVPVYQSTRVYKRFYEDYEDYQEQYDDETRHGTNEKNQKIWKDKITDELNSLSDFAEYRCY